MRKALIPIFTALLIFLIYQEFAKRELDQPPPPPVHKVTPPVKPSAPAKAPPAREIPPALGKTIAPEIPKQGERPKPPKGAVPFQRYGDLVVAFGDVLLGKPTHPDFPEQGFIEAPKLQYWQGGQIAYSFHPQLLNPERVQRVIDYFNQNTPVRFVPYTNQTDSIVFSPTTVPLCLSYVGKIGGHQPIYLEDRCGEKEITHELMHALGFIHEHSRPDRDNFVKVNWDKIEEDKQGQFEVAPLSLSEPQKNRPFDYQSIMIYNPTDFARQRGETTLESRTGTIIEPAPQGISPEDMMRLQILYSR